MMDAPAVLIPERGDMVRVEFDEPQWAPAPGQSAVFYDGEIVLGGGIIV
jgi:tRNA-specific 2-thiouridylase